MPREDDKIVSLDQRRELFRRSVAGGRVRLPIEFSPSQGATEGADGVAEVAPVDINASDYVEGRGPRVEKPVWLRKPSGQAVKRPIPRRPCAETWAAA